MPNPLLLNSQSVKIDAPRELVFQMLSSFRRGRIAGDSAESSRLVSEEGDAKIVEFKTKAGAFTYTTLEEVRLYPPERIAFKHLDGPLHFSEEEFSFEEIGDGLTILTHSGSFIWKTIPLFGWLGGVIYARPMYHRVIRKHFVVVKEAAEARAARSHIFRWAKR